MKTIIYSILGILSALLVMSFSSEPQVALSLSCDNLVLNGDAEGPFPLYNNTEPWIKEGVIIKVSDYDAATATSNSYFKTWNTDGKLSQDIKLPGTMIGKKATISGWLKRTDGSVDLIGEPRIVLEMIDANGAILGERILKSNSSTWDLVRKRITVPKNAVIARITLEAATGKDGEDRGGIEAKFDNVAFTECNETLPAPLI